MKIALPPTTVLLLLGSGITPLMSIVSDVLENNENSVFVLGYGNKTKASTMFSSAIDKLKSKYPKRFFCYNIYSQENNSEANFGRIDSNFINYVLKQHPQIRLSKGSFVRPRKHDRE